MKSNKTAHSSWALFRLKVLWNLKTAPVDVLLINLMLDQVRRRGVNDLKIKAPFSSRKFLTLSKIQNMKFFNVL